MDEDIHRKARRPGFVPKPEKPERPVKIDYQGFGNSLLICPHCGKSSYHGGGFLHHLRIEIFSRTEDANDVRIIAVKKVEEDAQITLVGTIPNNLSANPSSRRGGICIHFWCDCCGGVAVLNIAQHKGETLLSWDISEDGMERVRLGTQWSKTTLPDELSHPE